MEANDLQQSVRHDDCGTIGSYCGIGMTDGPSNWTGKRFALRKCDECDTHYGVRLPNSPSS